ncbi:MAG: hypothetical protein NTY19_01105, partial [Planctomycetota bacterium]|nr:hypothetical protein [Planctomycetota bacterium]
MRFRFPQRWLPCRRGWWWLAALVVVAAGLAIGSRWLPEVKQLATTWSAIGHGKALARVAGHDDHDHQGEAADAHAGEAADAHAGEAADAHEGEESTLEQDSHGKFEGTDHKHEEAAAVKLSSTAQDNVGLKLAKVELNAFERTITVPAMVVERPGRSAMQVAAPLTG